MLTTGIGVGPPVVLDGPLPLAPRFALLNTPDVLIDGGDEHWMNGAQIYTYPVDIPVNWDPCSVGTYRVKEEGGTKPIPYFSAFVTYLPITCSPAYVGDPLMFRDRASIALEAVESFAIEQALSQGIDQSLNPYFLDGNETLPAGTSAVKPLVGLSYLEEAIANSGRQGLIHAVPGFVIGCGISVIDTPGPYFTTKIGTPVSIGGGYLYAHLLGHTAPPAGQAWCFATGPVQVRHSEVIVTETRESLERHENVLTFRAERYVLATWDTAVQAAVLIDWNLI